MSGKRTIFILRSNPVDPDPRVKKMAETLIRDYSVKIFAWDRDGFRDASDSKIPYDIQFFQQKAAYGSGIRNLWKLLGWQFWLLKSLWKERKSISVIHACDFDTLLPALLIKLLSKIPIVYDIFDFYADHIRNTPAWLKRLISFVEKNLAKRADKIILPDEIRLNQLPGIESGKVTIIYNTPIDIFKSGNKEENQSFTLAYIGIIQKERGLFEIAKLVKAHPEWRLKIGGFGGDTEEFKNCIADYANIAWLGRIPYNQALLEYSKADLILALYDPAVANHRFASPNKLFEAMMLSRPVLVARNSNIDTIVSESNLGLVVNYGNLDEIEKSILKLADDPALCEQFGNNGRKLYESKYSWELMETRISSLYQEVLSR